MPDNDDEPTVVPINLENLPPALQRAIQEVVGEIMGGRPDDDDDDDDTASLGEVIFKLDRMLADPRHEPRLALLHSRMHPFPALVTADLDESLGRVHTYDETVDHITEVVRERVAFVESVRPALKHPDEIIALFETDYAITELIEPFMESLRVMLRSWKENPLRPHE